MNIELLAALLGWSAVINIGVLLYWSIILLLAPNWMYRVSTQWFAMSEQQFSTIQYCFLGGFKLCILFFNVVPYFAIKIVSG